MGLTCDLGAFAVCLGTVKVGLCLGEAEAASGTQQGECAMCMCAFVDKCFVANPKHNWRNRDWRFSMRMGIIHFIFILLAFHVRMGIVELVFGWTRCCCQGLTPRYTHPKVRTSGKQ